MRNTIRHTACRSSTRGLVESVLTRSPFRATTHVRQGDILPTGAAITDSHGKVLIPAYVVDKTILGKWIHKDAIKYYVGYSTQTEFFNSKNLSTNRYATWYFNKPARLSSYPIITFRLKEV